MLPEDEAKGWSPDRVERLKRLWASNETATNIAIEMGVGRGAICAKLARLGVQRRTKETPLTRAALAKRLEIRAAFVPAPSTPGSVQLEHLEDHQCRWPIGDPQSEGFGYCGAARHGRGPYCTGHTGNGRDPFTRGWKGQPKEYLRSLEMVIR